MKDQPIKYVFSLFDSLRGNEILMCYFGSVSFKISNNLINALRENLQADNIERVIYKRVYSSFVECIENITRHTSSGLGAGDKFGIVNVSKIGEEIVIHSGNLILKSDKDDLIGKIESIRSKTNQELREAYRKQIIQGSISDKGGAGLGILQIAINSNNNFSYNFETVDEEKDFFLLEIRITNQKMNA